MERYCYSAKVLNVIDGDTLDVAFSLGLSIFHETRVRLYGINTPELRSSDPAEREKAKAAKVFLTGLLGAQGGPVLLRTHKDGKEKFGRYLVEIAIEKDENGKLFTMGGTSVPRTVTEYMIEKGYGVAYCGGAR